MNIRITLKLLTISLVCLLLILALVSCNQPSPTPAPAPVVAPKAAEEIAEEIAEWIERMRKQKEDEEEKEEPAPTPAPATIILTEAEREAVKGMGAIRVRSIAEGEFLKALGGTPVLVAAQELEEAMKRGLIAGFIDENGLLITETPASTPIPKEG